MPTTDAPATSPPDDEEFDITGDIGAMIDAFNEDEPVERPELDSTDAPSTDAPDDPPATDPPDDNQEYEDRIAELEAKIKDLESPKTDPPATSAPATDPPIEDQDFLDGMDIDSVYDMSKDQLNELMNKVFKAGQATKSQPDVSKAVSDAMAAEQANKDMREKVDQFYADNEDLANFKVAVGEVLRDTMPKYIDDGIDKVLEETAKEARKRLNLKTPSNQPPDDDNPPPPPKSKKGRRGRARTDQRTDMQKDIDDMLKDT